MKDARTAAALRKIAEGIYELADAAFEASESVPAAPAHVWEAPATITISSGAGMPEFAEAAAEIFPEPQGSLAMCPKHKIPYTAGQYGDYCKSTTDDEAWGKRKGDKLWCRITPKNAATWLQMQAA